jgi:hypothetical protein
VDMAKFLSELHAKLEQIEQEIWVLRLFDAGTDSRLRLGPGLSASELERFRRNNATPRRGRDRMCWLQ